MRTFAPEETIDRICPYCEDDRSVEVGRRMETLAIKGEVTEYEARVERCRTCGRFFASDEMEEENLQTAFRLFRQRHRLLQPEDIREIREQYGLSQRAMSRLLKWGEITIHRYESGALQDEVHNELLVLLKDPENFGRLFLDNKNALSPDTAKKAETRLKELLTEKRKNRFQEMLESFFGKAREDILSGFRLFDLDRLSAAVLYLCKSDPAVTKVKLNKLLWYFDFLSFKTTGQSATGAVYVRLPYGPVPDNYQLYLSNMEQENLLEVEEIVYDSRKGISGYHYRAAVEPDLTVFQKDEILCLKKVSAFFKRKGAKSIADYSHREDAWTQTGKGDIISYEFAKTIRLENSPAHRRTRAAADIVRRT